VEILFEKPKIKKIFNNETELVRKYGVEISKRIKLRMNVLRSAPNLASVPSAPPDRCHELRASRKVQFAVDLSHPYRLIFRPTVDLIPRKEDGGIDREKVDSITIIEVVDYHD
jgi:proteic killer suppression protein